jgi:hypothetical protein
MTQSGHYGGYGAYIGAASGENSQSNKQDAKE